MKRSLARILRRAGLATVISLLLLGLLLIFGYGYVQSESGRQHLLEILNHQLTSPDGSGISIGRLEGDLFEHFEVHDLRVRDSGGTWLSLQYIVADWRIWDLLDGVVRLTSLDIEGLVVNRAPEKTESDGEFSWPGLPVVLSINQFRLGDTVLDDSLLGEEVVFRAVGDTIIEGAERVKSRIELTRVGDISGQAKLDASFLPVTQYLSLNLNYDEASGGLLARVLGMDELPVLSVNARAEGPLDELKGQAGVSTGDDVSLLDIRFTLSLEAQPRWEIDGQAQLTKIIDEALRPYLPGSTRFDLRGQFNKTGFVLTRGSLANDLAQLGISGNLDNFAADFDLAVKLDDIHKLADITGVSFHSQADIKAHIISGDIRKGAKATLDSGFSKIHPLSSQWLAVVGERVTLRGDIGYEVGQPWSFKGISINGEAVKVSINASLGNEPDSLDAEYKIQIPRLAALSEALGSSIEGELMANGNIKGELTEPALSVQMHSPDLWMDGFNVGAVDARVNFPQINQNLMGDAELTINQNEYGLVRLKSLFSLLDENQLRFDELEIESRDSKLVGGVSVDLAGVTVSANMAGDNIPLAPWSSLAGRSLAGNADVSIGISNDGKKHSLELAANGKGLDIELDEKDSLRVKSLIAKIKVKDLLGEPTSSMRLLATDSRLADTQLEEVIFEGRMNKPDLVQSRLQIQGEIQGPFELEAEADYGIRENGFSLDVSRLSVSMFDPPVNLEGRLQLEQVNDIINLTESAFNLAGGRVLAKAQIEPDKIALTLNASEISIAKLDKIYSNSDLSGIVSGNLLISGSRNDPQGDLVLQVDDLQTAQSKIKTGLPVSVSGELRGKWRDEKLQLNASLSELATDKLLARATLPLRLDKETLLITVPSNEAIKGRVSWSGDLEPLWNLFSQREDRFTGKGEVALELEGHVGDPRVGGHFQVTDGRYENMQSTTTLVGLNLRLTGNGDKLVLEEFAAGDGKSGSISGSGSIDLNPDQSYPINMHLKAKDLLLVALDELNLNASADLSLQGNLSEALLSGEIITGQSELDLSGSLPLEIVELEVEEINASSAKHSSDNKPTTKSASSRLGLDLKITVPGKSFIRGLGLESEWRGEIKVDGFSEAPKVSGTLSPVRGRYNLMGKSFSLESGTIRFTGSDDIDPILDITAEHSASSITALVQITGTASNPDIKLTSRPPLPESEIASEVLFGTNSGNLTTAQSLQLATAVTSNNTRMGGLNILDSTRRLLGVDVIGFTDSEMDSNSARVSVGKYVADGVFLEVEGGGEKDSYTSTTVEVELMPNVRFEGGTTETGGSKVGIRWKWDY